ncbi:hypothetical protein B005_1833 [Nocardiopsis alba ATCC BAA-2165]|uniref:Uncharacterized protein n=1 Tax=Nocardiopsis alba (strain ATCC BAA-2165 / BE74) TaxID=1205910 RepID=J7L6V1_NOCAA|nr:hypothetical protein B005_1833 [Nocardiopsis alba ATCC BAA-2165]
MRGWRGPSIGPPGGGGAASSTMADAGEGGKRGTRICGQPSTARGTETGGARSTRRAGHTHGGARVSRPVRCDGADPVGRPHRGDLGRPDSGSGGGSEPTRGRVVVPLSWGGSKGAVGAPPIEEKGSWIRVLWGTAGDLSCVTCPHCRCPGRGRTRPGVFAGWAWSFARLPDQTLPRGFAYGLANRERENDCSSFR